MKDPNIHQSPPLGWPEGTPFRWPTQEEAEKAEQEGEQMITEMLDNLKTKVVGPTSEMLNTVITL